MITIQNLSFWEKESFINHVDYLIVGSGIVGLSTAIYLKERKKDKKVTVLERGFLPTGASTKNAGFSCIGSPSELLSDLSKNSEDTVFATVEKRWKGLLNLNSLLGEQNIGYKSLGSHELFDDSNRDLYQNCLDQLPELNKHLGKITGIKTVYSAADQICYNSGFKAFNAGISHAAEGQIDTGKMMRALVKKAQEMGVLILNDIEVLQLNEKSVDTNHGTIPFQKIAFCTNGFSKRFFPDIDIEPARAQVIVTSEIENLKLKGIFHFDEGYYYFRNIGNRILFGGGRNLDFMSEKTEKLENTTLITTKLIELLRTQIAPYAKFEIEHQWAGTMGVGTSKSPIIREVMPGVFCGIRLGGMGVAIGSLVGKELADLMIEK